MLKGSGRSDTGAVGNVVKRVENVARVYDREVVFDGSGDDHDAPFTQWVAMGNDTLNVVSDPDHVLGRRSLEFDKVNGAANTKIAAVVNANLDLDLSRFLGSDRLVALFQIPDLTDVDYVAVRLGTDASNYNEWRMADTEITAAVWQEMNVELQECEYSVTGEGWNPENVKYAAFCVAFDLETDALADIILDHVVVREHSSLSW